MYKIEAEFHDDHGRMPCDILFERFNAENDEKALEKSIELITQKANNSKRKNEITGMWYKLLKSNELFVVHEIKRESLKYVDNKFIPYEKTCQHCK